MPCKAPVGNSIAYAEISDCIGMICATTNDSDTLMDLVRVFRVERISVKVREGPCIRVLYRMSQ